MEGRVFSYIHFNGQVGSLVKISTETDFASRTEEFQAFGKFVAAQIAVTDPQTVDELLAQESIHNTGFSIGHMTHKITDELGEYVSIVAFQRFSVK